LLLHGTTRIVRRSRRPAGGQLSAGPTASCRRWSV